MITHTVVLKKQKNLTVWKNESENHLAQPLHNAELYQCSISNSWLPNLHADNTIKEKYTNSAKCNLCQFAPWKKFLLIFSQWNFKGHYLFFISYYANLHT